MWAWLEAVILTPQTGRQSGLRCDFQWQSKKYPSPKKFSQPRFKSFCSDSDLDYHIMHYQNVMALYNNNNAWMCKMFLCTLEWPTMRWYFKLPARYINCFETLADIIKNIRKCHEAMFWMVPSPKMEVSRLIWITFKQNWYNGKIGW